MSATKLELKDKLQLAQDNVFDARELVGAVTINSKNAELLASVFRLLTSVDKQLSDVMQDAYWR